MDKAGCTSTRAGRISPSRTVWILAASYTSNMKAMMCSVKVFDETTCRKYNYIDDKDTDDESDDDVKPCIHPL
jgi:hypothetical protein